MTDTNGVKPSNEELNELIQLCEADDLVSLDIDLIVCLARAELQRRQQPAASVPAELPDDLLWKWFKDSLKRRDLHELNSLVLRDVAREAAAYGRGQSRIDGMKKALTLIDEFADKHLEGERLAGAVQCLGVLDTAISREPPTC